MSDDTILIICAHPDDQILGPGGTMAKYARDGYDVVTVICTYGESSHPHIKREKIREIRLEESKDADKIVGGDGVLFLGLEDGNMGEDLKKRDNINKIRNLIREYEPTKIFTHSVDDLHPDHRAVRKAILKSYDEVKKEAGFECDVYTFEVWNIVNLLKRKQPRLIVDISKDFQTKIKALHAFKSQISVFTHTVFNNLLYLGVYIKDFINGVTHGYRFAEVFYKER